MAMCRFLTRDGCSSPARSFNHRTAAENVHIEGDDVEEEEEQEEDGEDATAENGEGESEHKTKKEKTAEGKEHRGGMCACMGMLA